MGVAVGLALGACTPEDAADRSARPEVDPSDPAHVRVLAMSDLHGALVARPDLAANGRLAGGVAALAAAMDSASAECDCLTLRVDAGDQMQGTLESNLFFGASTVEALNQLGLDAAAIGNHELDWSVDTLRQRVAEADYAWLAANVFDSATGQRPAWAKPYQVVERSGLRIAFIGFITSTTKSIVRAPYVSGLAFGQGRASIEDVLEEVRAERPDLTILTAHAGMRCGAVGCTGEIVSLAQELEGENIDLIVAGHMHLIDTVHVGTIPVIQVGANGAVLGVIDLRRGEAGDWRAEMEVRPVYLDEVTPNPTMLEMVARSTRATDSIADRRVATLREAPARRASERDLGNIIADALRSAASADIGLINNGGIRAGLPQGAITYRMAFTVMPFGNELVRVTLSGQALRRLLDNVVGGVHASGLRITYDAQAPRGDRLVELRLSDGRPLADDAQYTVALPEFLAEGGDGFAALSSLPREYTGMTGLDALIDHLQRAPQPFEMPSGDRIRAQPR